MPTLNQILNPKKGRHKKKSLVNCPALRQNPQQKGTCDKIFTCSPKKPNSAVRKAAKVTLWYGKSVNVYIPGEKHTLKRHNDVLIRGGRTQDLPGFKYKAIPGKYDFHGYELRKTRRSLYGTKREELKF